MKENINHTRFNQRQVLSAAGVAIIGGTMATGSAAADGHDGVQSYSAELTGDEQVPPVETNASGHATFEVDAEQGEDHYKVHIDFICNATQAHIHLGEPGENGPVIAWLYPEDQQEPELIEGRFEGTLAEGTLTEDDLVGPLEGASFEEAIETVAAEGAYVNVHTEQYPEGEIRGQIIPDDEPEEREERPEEPEEEPERDDEPDEPEKEDEEEEPEDPEPDPDPSLSLGSINVGEGVAPEDEYITIVNEGDEVNLQGYVLRDGPGGVVDTGTVSAYTFPSYTLGEGESVTVYTDDNPAADLSWGIGRQIWNQEGDTVIVEDADGNVVMEETYPSQVSSISAAVDFVRSLLV